VLICAAGDIHGAMDRLYQDVSVFEASLGVCFDHVLHVGDFGIWPDPNRIDKATRHHDGAGDFPAWLKESRVAPRPTVFIKGNHEDFVWLDAHQDAEVLPGLWRGHFKHASHIRIWRSENAVSTETQHPKNACADSLERSFPRHSDCPKRRKPRCTS
jgi:Calcineurin-like phosphoesterase